MALSLLGKKSGLNLRQRKFLALWAESGDVGSAYMGAGFKVKSRLLAQVAGHRLLRKIDSTTGLNDIFASMGLGDVDMVRILARIATTGEDVNAIKAVHLVAKAKRWFGEESSSKGAQIIIQAAPPPNPVLKQCNVVEIKPKQVESGEK